MSNIRPWGWRMWTGVVLAVVAGFLLAGVLGMGYVNSYEFGRWGLTAFYIAWLPFVVRYGVKSLKRKLRDPALWTRKRLVYATCRTSFGVAVTLGACIGWLMATEHMLLRLHIL